VCGASFVWCGRRKPVEKRLREADNLQQMQPHVPHPISCLTGLALCLVLPERANSQATDLVEVLDNYCVSCHNPSKKKGALDLESILSGDIVGQSDTWEKVITRMQAREMPPPKKDRPSEAEYGAVLESLIGKLDAHAATSPTPGRVATFRRLNRTEYQNAIRDLLAVDIDAASLLPKDEESHGFDNVTVGTLSPTLVDRYITSAQKISRLAVGAATNTPGGETFRIPPDFTQEKHVDGLPIGTRGGALIPYTFPRDGEYEIEVLLSRDRNEHVEGMNGTHEMEILLDGAVVKAFTVKSDKDHSQIDKHLKTRFTVSAGPKSVGVTFLQKSSSLLENKRQPFEASFNLHRHPRRSPAVYQVSITGPFESNSAGESPSRKRVFVAKAEHGEAAARVILGRLMKLGYRRAVNESDFEKPMGFFRTEAEFEAGIESALTSVLVSPEFLFRVEKEPEGEGAYQISDIELASRLSFFIWSSIPDEALLDLAIANKLSEPEVLESEVKRLLADPRAESLVDNFAGQWLHLRNLDSVVPDLRLFPDFDDNLRQAFRQETELFVASVFREGRSVLDLLKADYTYLNDRLARHYGIRGVYGNHFRRVSVTPDDHRGGLLRQGSILTVTSYATRTSPVIRGNWVLENILGTPAPPPPPNTPTLEENKVDAELPMRELLAKHRADSACATCHDRMDPVGFALENFDAVGRWREFENGGDIDVAGGLPDGRTLVGVEKLEEGLLERPELFVRTLSEKLLTFALGRGVEAFDAPAVREIVKEARENDARFSAIVLGIVKSVPFQMRGRESE
jgi:hypothetical protein